MMWSYIIHVSYLRESDSEYVRQAAPLMTDWSRARSHFGKPYNAILQYKSILDKMNAVITVASDERLSERRMHCVSLRILK